MRGKAILIVSVLMILLPSVISWKRRSVSPGVENGMDTDSQGQVVGAKKHANRRSSQVKQEANVLDSARAVEVEKLVEESVGPIFLSSPESKLYWEYLQSLIPEKGPCLKAFRIVSFYGSQRRDLDHDTIQMEAERRFDQDPNSVPRLDSQIRDLRLKNATLTTAFSANMRRLHPDFTDDDLKVLSKFRPETDPRALNGVSDEEFFSN